MYYSRLFSLENQPYHGITFEPRTSTVRNKDGSVRQQLDGIVVPSFWSQTATDILAQKYMRKAGVPSETRPLTSAEKVPDWLARSVPVEGATLGRETDCRQVFHRLAGAWTHHAYRSGYFAVGPDGKDDKGRSLGWSVADGERIAHVFYDELCMMLALQLFAPASPQWFNTGLFWAYGIVGQDSGLWVNVFQQGDCRLPSDDGSDSQWIQTIQRGSYRRPLVHACFIQSVEDSLLGEHGIMSIVEREGRVFKFGGGSGSNFSALRGEGEPLTAGGKSSGMMSFLQVADRSAGAIKSGGTTRRAAKMVVVDADHPDIEHFVTFKVREEDKVAAMVAGSHVLATHMNAIAVATHRQDAGHVEEVMRSARRAGVPETYIRRARDLAAQGAKEIALAPFNTEFEGEAYATVNGQNANNSVRVCNLFMESVLAQGDWPLYHRTELRKAETENRQPSSCKILKAEGLWGLIHDSAWACADPGIQFDTTIQDWNGCLADGRIEASNPCSEYLWLNDTGCNLASLNLVRFAERVKGVLTFQIERFRHAVYLVTTVLDVTVDMASYPSERIAKGSHDYRTLGLGYANLGSLLMRQGHPYDSDQGRAIAAAITCILHCEATICSARLAKELGTFPRYTDNEEGMRRVTQNHARAVLGGELSGLHREPMPVAWPLAGALYEAAKQSAIEMTRAVHHHGLRNAQLTLLAPTGTIGLVMDCDTTGVEPDFALVKFKKLAGGGYMKLVNGGVIESLTTFGYDPATMNCIVKYACGHGTLEGCPHVTPELLAWGGLAPSQISDFEKHLPSAMDVRHLIIDWPQMSLEPWQWEEVNAYICGMMTVEGAPGLKPEHYSVFACANKCGALGKQYLSPESHIDMMGAVQPFLSGAISKTINLPEGYTSESMKAMTLRAWRNMLKAVAYYREGSKLSQPLNTTDEVLMTDNGNPAVQMAERVIYRYLAKRRGMPSRCAGVRQKVRIGGHAFYYRTGNYEDGTLGEVFIDMHKEGAAFRSFANALAIAVSLGLQHGVPLEEFVDAFCFMTFEPNGPVQGHAKLKNCTSIIDVIFRDLAIEYLGRNDLAHVIPPGGVDTVHTEPEWTEEEAAPVKPVRSGSVKEARHKGYEGNPCVDCGRLTMIRSGSCLRCDSCGATTGCV